VKKRTAVAVDVGNRRSSSSQGRGRKFTLNREGGEISLPATKKTSRTESFPYREGEGGLFRGKEGEVGVASVCIRRGEAQAGRLGRWGGEAV